MRPESRTARGARALALAAALLTAVSAAGGKPALARPLEVEDVLHREAYGPVALAPNGRWLVVALRGPYASGRRFDYWHLNPLFRTRPMMADLRRPGSLRPLFRPTPGYGYQLGPFSPDGEHIAVIRLTGERWELGVASLSHRSVRWLGVAPESILGARALQWLSATELVVVARAPGDSPLWVRHMHPQMGIADRWALQARGAPSATTVGSGADLAVRPRAPAKRLIRISIGSGRAKRLAEGDFTDLEVAPAGRWLAALEAADDIPLESRHAVQGPFGVAMQRQRLVMVDLQTGAASRPCPGWDLLGSLLAWNPAGDALLVYARRDGAPWPDGRLLRVDAAAQAVAAVADGIQLRIEHRPEVVYAGWWRNSPIVFGRAPAAERDDWYLVPDAHELSGPSPAPINLTAALTAPLRPVIAAGREGLLTPAAGGVWELDGAGHTSPLAQRSFALAAPPHEDGPPLRTAYGGQAADRLAGVLSGPAGPRAVQVGPGGPVGPGVPLAADDVLFAVSADGMGALVSRRPPNAAETLTWLSADHPPRPLASINHRYADVDAPRATAVPHPGPEGQALKSWMLIPNHSARPGHPPPLVVWDYPGSTFATDPAPGVLAAPPAEPTGLLVAAGYAVLIPSLPNPRRDDGPADHLAERILAIVDAAAAQPGLAGRFDAGRLAIWGYSFGGYGALAAVAETDRFRAAIAAGSPTDLVGMEGIFGNGYRRQPEDGVSTAGTAGWTEDLQGAMHAPPWAEPDRYIRNSPVLNAGAIQTPVLLFHGEFDDISLTQSEEMFSALYRQNKDARLVTYWGEPHVIGSPGNLRDYYRQAFAWLRRYLLADELTPHNETRPRRPESTSASAAPRTRPPRPG